jgi:hypothetical protein
MRPAVSVPIRGSEKTLLGLAVVAKGGDVRFLSAGEAPLEDAAPEKLLQALRPAASSILAAIKPIFIRDEKGVISFVVLNSEDPPAAAAVLAPDFIERFRDSLGPDLLVAIPNRHRVYVFPKLASRFQHAADLIIRDYETSAWPVSKEVFEIHDGVLRAIGIFQE